MDQNAPKTLRLGFLINPYAGLGGPAGFKGSDNTEQMQQVLTAEQAGRSTERAKRCLERLLPFKAQLECVCAAGVMGQELLQSLGFSHKTITQPNAQPCAEDTQAFVAQLLEHSVDLLVFVGGDGTARDVCAVLGEQLPVLGIPAGVKMHSGVFAVAPEATAEVIVAMLQADLVDLQLQEVRDIDEALLQQGRVNSRHYGDMKVPQCGQFVQSTKQSGVEVEELVVDDIVDYLQELMGEADQAPESPGQPLYLIGAGNTTQALMQALGLPNTLLGVDVVLNSEVVLADANAQQLEERVLNYRGPVVALLSVTANQGALIGRGNQQLTPAVLERIGKQNIWALATKGKIKALQGRPLILDTHDYQLDVAWSGFIEVITGYQDRILYPLGFQSANSDEDSRNDCQSVPHGEPKP